MNTLNDMTPEQLRDLAKRASATADTKEQEARKAEKDIIPPPGTFWRYNKRVWTVAEFEGVTRLLISADTDGGDVRYWFFSANRTFTELRNGVIWHKEAFAAGGYPLSELRQSIARKTESIQSAIGKLILTARDIK